MSFFFFFRFFDERRRRQKEKKSIEEGALGVNLYIALSVAFIEDKEGAEAPISIPLKQEVSEILRK